jgi:hypothetical protein
MEIQENAKLNLIKYLIFNSNLKELFFLKETTKLF